MINSTQNIPCPVCGTAIPFQVELLLGGTKFSCHNCKAAISIANESRPVVEDTMEKFNEMKKQLEEERNSNA